MGSRCFMSAAAFARATPNILCYSAQRHVRRVSAGCRRNESEDDVVPLRDPVLKAISEVSKGEERVAQTTNVVMGGSLEDDWQVIDNQVNTYPMHRAFTAIGIGGDDFVHAMVLAVETALDCSIPQEIIRSKLSAKGKYVSVKIGPIIVTSSEQVRAIYSAMRCDNRMKYFL